MNFKVWLINESSLRDALKGVPQNPKTHPEGDVFTHASMVRRFLKKAVNLLKKEQGVFPFSKIDFRLNKKEIKLLKLCAWLHDIGKSTATKIDGRFWKDSKNNSGEVSAKGHDKPNHYEPAIEKLGVLWKKTLDNLQPDELQDIYFCIDHHMSIRDGKLLDKTAKIIKDKDGNYKNKRRVKLLLCLMIMDQSGREKIGGLKAAKRVVKVLKSN